VGDEAVPVVREEAQRPYFGRVLAVGDPDELQSTIDWMESLASLDDIRWAYIVVRKPFTWQRFLNWWVARRYVQPRDVRRR
jgi:hypothetical protein